MDPDNRPEPFKRFPNAERIELPRDIGSSGVAASAILSGTAGGKRGGVVDERLIARLLFYSAGVSRVRSRDGQVVGWFRAAPAAGNLHPVETYLFCGALGEIPPGIHHFNPGDFSLESVRTGDRRAALAAALASDESAVAPVSLVLTGVPWRTGWKYTSRGFRHIYWDAGSLAAQTLAVADAAGVAARVHVGFVDAELSDELGLDGVSEFPVAVITLGEPAERVASGEESALVGGEPERVSKTPFEFPLVTRTQHAGDLTDAAEVDQWRKAAAEVGQPAAPPLPFPPDAEADRDDIEALIRRRGSTRMFRPEEIPPEVAQWCLGVGSRAVPADFVGAGRTLLSHFVSVHSISGVPPGRHQWIDGALTPRTKEDSAAARAEALRLCLGQPLGGDSAFSTFHCADLDELLGALGDRGYRAAQLEAGLVAGRLQLAAFAVGLGATGLTFFDDAVSAAFQTNASCMLVTAVGASDYRSRAGGLPGRPTEMSGFAPSVVARFKARYETDDK